MGLFSKKIAVGLVLSGGAVRGMAHLGVLQALIEKKINIGIISGASAGALAAAFFAQGYSPKETMEIISKKKIYEFLRISFPRTGFFKIDGLKKILKGQLKAKNIEDLPLPIVIAATNLLEGKIEYLTEGPLIDSLIASASIPSLFEVSMIRGIPFIDGGVMDNLPVYPLKEKCKKIIAVNTNPVGKIEKIKHPAQIAERAFHLAIASDIRRKREMVSLFIEPQKLQEYGMFDMKKAQEIFQIGYDAAIETLNGYK